MAFKKKKKKISTKNESFFHAPNFEFLFFEEEKRCFQRERKKDPFVFEVLKTSKETCKTSKRAISTEENTQSTK